MHVGEAIVGGDALGCPPAGVLDASICLGKVDFVEKDDLEWEAKAEDEDVMDDFVVGSGRRSSEGV